MLFLETKDGLAPFTDLIKIVPKHGWYCFYYHTNDLDASVTVLPIYLKMNKFHCRVISEMTTINYCATGITKVGIVGVP